MQIDKLAVATVVTVSLAVTAPFAALASNGSDDPAGHLRNGRDDGARAAAASGGPSASGARTLRASVGPGYTISLTRNGRTVRSLAAGRYRFVVVDRARTHDFVLEQERGGRVARELSDVGEIGTRSVTVELTPGTWTYYCEPHRL